MLLRSLPSVLLGLTVSFVPSALSSGLLSDNPCGTCTTKPDLWAGGWWTVFTPTETIEAATVVIVTNNRTNTTRTTTIWNLPENATVPPTNSDGTIVYTKTLTWGSETISTVLAYPTGYLTFQPGVTFSGAIPVAATSLPTATNGLFSNLSQPSCTTATKAIISSYPSLQSPVWPTSSLVLTFTETVKGAVTLSTLSRDVPYDKESFYLWSFVDFTSLSPEVGCKAPWDMGLYDYSAAYPDFLPYTYCEVGTTLCGPSALETAAYLTVTSHSHEDTAPSTTAGPAESQAGAASSAADQEGATASASKATATADAAPGSSAASSQAAETAAAPSPASGSATGDSGSPNSPQESANTEPSPGPAGGESAASSNTAADSGIASVTNAASPAPANGATAVSIISITLVPAAGSDNSDQASSGSIAWPGSGGSAPGAPGSTAVGLSGESEASLTVGQPYTYISGDLSTVVTPTTDESSNIVIAFTSTPATEDQTAITTALAYTTIPLSDIPSSLLGPSFGSDASELAGAAPFTYVSGSVTEVVTPTIIDGSTVVILSSSATLTVPAASATDSAALGSYIASGLGGSTTQPSGSETATQSDVAQVTTNAGNVKHAKFVVVGAAGMFALAVAA